MLWGYKFILRRAQMSVKQVTVSGRKLAVDYSIQNRER
jgi:hypothetical protein